MGRFVDRVVVRVVRRIHSDLDHAWNVQELARLSGYTPHHFARVFAQKMGVGFGAYVRNVRLERAAGELVSQRVPSLLDVALRAGYGSHEAFTRAFRRSFGKSPSAYREEWRAAHGDDGDRGGRLPQGLRLVVACAPLGPLYGWTCRVESFEGKEAAEAAKKMLRVFPCTRPWQFGSLVQPWGWVEESPNRAELELVRYCGEGREDVPALDRWQQDTAYYATFVYEGERERLGEVCAWLVERWMLRTQGRVVFWPILTVLKDPYAGSGPVRIHIPVIVK